MGDAHCSDCRGATEVVFDHVACDTVCSECGPGRWQNRCCDPDESLISGFRTIASMCDRLGLVAGIKGRACEILKKADDFYNNQRNKDAVLATCLYIACRREHSPCKINEICSVANGATRKEILRTERYILQEQRSCRSVDYTDAMSRFRSDLALSLQAVKAAPEAVQKSEKVETRMSDYPSETTGEEEGEDDVFDLGGEDDVFGLGGDVTQPERKKKKLTSKEDSMK